MIHISAVLGTNLVVPNVRRNEAPSWAAGTGIGPIPPHSIVLGLTPLPETADEVQAVGRLFGGQSDALLLGMHSETKRDGFTHYGLVGGRLPAFAVRSRSARRTN